MKKLILFFLGTFTTGFLVATRINKNPNSLSESDQFTLEDLKREVKDLVFPKEVKCVKLMRFMEKGKESLGIEIDNRGFIFLSPDGINEALAFLLRENVKFDLEEVTEMVSFVPTSTISVQAKEVGRT